MSPTPRKIGSSQEAEIDEVETQKRMARFQNHDFTKFKELAFGFPF